MRLYLKQQEVSRELVSRIEKYIDHRNRVKKDRIQKEGVPCLKGLSQELTGQLTLEICAQHLQHLLLFNVLYKKMHLVMRSICSEALSFQSFAENEEVFRFSNLGKKVYFLHSGNMEYVILNEPTQPTPLDPPPMPKEAISEAVLWMQWIHQGTLTVLTPTELVLLDPDIFSKIMTMSPEPWSMAVKYAENFIKFLNSLERSAFIDIIRQPFFFRLVHSASTRAFD